MDQKKRLQNAYQSGSVLKSTKPIETETPVVKTIKNQGAKN